MNPEESNPEQPQPPPVDYREDLIKGDPDKEAEYRYIKRDSKLRPVPTVKELLGKQDQIVHLLKGMYLKDADLVLKWVKRRIGTALKINNDF